MVQSKMTMVFNAMVSESFGAVFRFPVWWFTEGMMFVVVMIQRLAKFYLDFTGLGVWSRNLAVPMYGDNSHSGRIISFCIRLFIVMFLGFFFVGWLILLFMILVLYVLALPLVSVGIFQYLFSL